MATFKTTILQANDMNATGFAVPQAVVQKLGAGKRPKVRVALNGYSYRSTVAVYGGKFFLPLAADHRAKAGVAAGDTVTVILELDTAPREVEVPKDLASALKKAGARAAFDALAFSHRKEHVRAIEESKAPDTRARRIEKAVQMVHRQESMSRGLAGLRRQPRLDVVDHVIERSVRGYDHTWFVGLKRFEGPKLGAEQGRGHVVPKALLETGVQGIGWRPRDGRTERLGVLRARRRDMRV